MADRLQRSQFWAIVPAIKEFVAKHDAFPLPGSLPDMKAQSSDYICLQNIYKNKSRRDYEEVLASVRAFEKKTGFHPGVDERDIEAFCKGAPFVKVLRPTGGADSSKPDGKPGLPSLIHSPLKTACKLLP
jgi:NEDD8-activating enzyme E1 regulatory subunit